MIVGSLIKNPGGGLAPIGGYIAGKEALSRELRVPPDIPRTWQGGRRDPSASMTVACTRASSWPLPSCPAQLEGAVFAGRIQPGTLGYRRRCPTPPNAAARHHPGRRAGQPPEAVVAFCTRHPGRRAGGQRRHPATLGDMPGYDSRRNHGGRRVRAGLLHRACAPTARFAPPLTRSISRAA